MANFFIELKDGHRYEFNKIRGLIGDKIIMFEGQSEAGKRFIEYMIMQRTIKDTNIPLIKMNLPKDDS